MERRRGLELARKSRQKVLVKFRNRRDRVSEANKQKEIWLLSHRLRSLKLDDNTETEVDVLRFGFPSVQ